MTVDLTLWQVLRPISRPKLLVADIGAAQIDEPPPYLEMQRMGMVAVVGFEPQTDLIAVGQGLTLSSENIVADGSDRIFRTCAAPGMSSLYEPDKAACRAFAGFGQFSNVTATSPCTTVTLGTVCPTPDWLKMDCQGAELEIMRSAPHALDHCAVVHLEVPFVPLYEGQPTFGEIDLFMRGRGFLPHTFAHIKKWLLTPLAQSPRPPTQLLEADIVYVRNFIEMSKMQDDHLPALALIAHYAYDSTDLTARCLQELVRRGRLPVSTLKDYVASL